MTWKEKQTEKILTAMGSNITGLSDIVGDGKPSAIFYLLAYQMAYLMSGNAEEVLSERTVRLRRKLTN